MNTVESSLRLSNEMIAEFQEKVYSFYRRHGRRLPWRCTTEPYKILVSEIMLQQTQVSRVLGKYEPFIKKFPDFQSLACAPLRDILAEWQGLGYNRRALALKQISERVLHDFSGRFPSDTDTLETFPGVGRATASAICAFAFNEPVVFIETNIRTVFIHHFFRDANIKDKEICPLVAQTLDSSKPRIWYYALMDYGVGLKKIYGNPGKRSFHYQKQPPFRGSSREIRGHILRILIETSSSSEDELFKMLPFQPAAVKQNLVKLEREGLVNRQESRFSIA